MYMVIINNEKADKSEKDLKIPLFSCNTWTEDNEVPINDLIEFYKLVS